jgi:Rod binding domain-containing protein
MDLQGIRTTVNTKLTDDDRRGLRRSKALSTSLQASTKPRNTSIVKLPANTHVSTHDLSASHAKGTAASQHDRLVKQTQTWVAQTFFGTLMKQMRDSPFKSNLLDGGRGGQAFSELYDQHLSERMSRGAGSHLVNSIVHRIEARAAAVKQQATVGRKAA